MATAVILKFKIRHIFGERYCITVPLVLSSFGGTAFPCVLPRSHRWRWQLFQIQKLLYLCNAHV